jgi:hypothetical protein
VLYYEQKQFSINKSRQRRRSNWNSNCFSAAESTFTIVENAGLEGSVVAKASEGKFWLQC